MASAPTAADGGSVPRYERLSWALAVALTTDHKADLPAEQARIESMGGYVRPTFEDDGEFMPARVYEFQGRPWLGPGLCVARALGDLEGVRCGIIPTPEVCTHTVQEEDLFLILASDGVWEFIENEEAVRIVRLFHEQGKPALDACRFLIAKAALLWRTNEGQYRDDITAIVVYLRPVVQGLEAEVSNLSRAFFESSVKTTDLSSALRRSCSRLYRSTLGSDAASALPTETKSPAGTHAAEIREQSTHEPSICLTWALNL